MKRIRRATLLAGVASLCALPAVAPAHTTNQSSAGAGLTAPGDAFNNFTLEAAFPLPTATSSDIAFWGTKAYVGNYAGFRIFDISEETPKLLANVLCDGPQGDPSVWDRDRDGNADLLILSVDRTMKGPECGAAPAAHDDPNGWEGLRLFDVSDPANVTQIATVYQDCGSHTNTIIPRLEENRLLVLNSSYPLRPGPTCGPVRGPEAGRDPLHGTVQVVEIPLADPTKAKEITELPITYPGDNDNKYLPISEHGINGGEVGNSGLVDGMRACHDIGVFIETGLVAAACGEQAQVWRLDKRTGLPDTKNPLWVYDQDNVDFWHSATFSWDGKIVNFIDESFGTGCPTKTVKRVRLGREPREYETGNMFFMNARNGHFYSEFRIPRTSQDTGYCSSHLGNVIPTKDRYLLANAYYRAGSSVIDFTKPRQPREVAYGDRSGAGTWSTYWYETPAEANESLVDVYANDGVDNVAADKNGFESWAVTLGSLRRLGMPYLNPQTQENVLHSMVNPDAGGKKGKAARSEGRRYRRNLGRYAKGRATKRGMFANADVLDHLATK
jgi:hypothetical protein